MDIFASLNARQLEAVRHTAGPLLILAGAGSGKTRVIITRIANLIANHGVSPRALLAVTFTNKAADEMRTRVGKALDAAGASLSSAPTVSTFHSFCVRLLRSHGAPLASVRQNFGVNFNIYDDSDQLAVIKSVYRRLGLDEKFMKARSALSVISAAKNKGLGPQDLYADATSPQSEKLAVIFERYQDALIEANALDFDDLLVEAVRLLKQSPEVRQAMHQRYRYVMVDEYQDTNRPQYNLMKLMVGPERNLAVVGDEDQSIYSWRGADIQNILQFEKDFPNAVVIRLEQNYRSTKPILDAAGAVVANNIHRKGKVLWTDQAQGDPIVFYRASSGEDEALYVAGLIDRYLKEHPKESAAILYRTNSQSRQMEEALRRFDRKYLVLGGLSFYQRAEVKDLIAYLKAGVAPADNVSLLRIINTPARGIGATTVQQLEAIAAEHQWPVWRALEHAIQEKSFGARAHNALAVFHKLIAEAREKVAAEPLDQALEWLLEETGYREMLEKDASVEAAGRLDNINELLNAAADAVARNEDVHAFLDHAALVSDTDNLDEHAKVVMMTLHSAKGLEFPLVAIIGMDEGYLPHSRSFEDEDAMEEERRLCYVGMTRARKRLVLTCASERRRYGGGSPEPMRPSRFLSEIPSELLDNRSPAYADSYLGDGCGDEDGEWRSDGFDLNVERRTVRQLAENRLGGLKTYNSAENVAEFFAKRGIAAAVPGGRPAAPAKDNARPAAPSAPAKSANRFAPPNGAKPRGLRAGSRVRHPKYGRGTIMRLEGDGADAKLTVHFQQHGLKKLIAKYAALEQE